MPDPALQSGSIRAELCEISRINVEKRESMLQLLQWHFDGVDSSAFYDDLNAKQGAILISHSDGTLCGFSTWLFYDVLIDGELLRVAYFGDTIVAKEAWNSAALPGAVIKLLMGEVERVAPRRLFSLLICSGFRTYRFMPFFCNEFVPRDAMDSSLLALRDRLALDRFGPQFDAQSGIVKLQRGAYRTKKGLSEPDGHVEVDDASAYFFRANPGWENGEELVCLAEMKESNLSAISRRLLKKPS